MHREVCPSNGRLLAFLLGEMPSEEMGELRQHFDRCKDCQSRLVDLRAALCEDLGFLKEQVPEIVSAVHTPRAKHGFDKEMPSRASAGDLYLVRSAEGSVRRLVLCLDSPEPNEPVVAALISGELEMASDQDMIIGEEDSPVGFSIMVESWNQFPVRAYQREKFFGSVDKELVLAVTRLGRSPNAAPYPGLRVGIGLANSDDPRIGFQLSETDATGALSAPSFDLTVEESPAISNQVDNEHRQSGFRRLVDLQEQLFDYALVHWSVGLSEQAMTTCAAACTYGTQVAADFAIHGDVGPWSALCLDFGSSALTVSRLDASTASLVFSGSGPGSQCRLGPKESLETETVLVDGIPTVMDMDELAAVNTVIVDKGRPGEESRHE